MLGHSVQLYGVQGCQLNPLPRLQHQGLSDITLTVLWNIRIAMPNIYYDHTPSLVKAAGCHDWAEIVTAVGDTGTNWRLTSKGCSWRNGQAEGHMSRPDTP